MHASTGNITLSTSDMLLNAKKHLENFGLEVAIGG